MSTAIAITSDGKLHSADDAVEAQPIRFHYLYSVDAPFSVLLRFEIGKGQTVTWEFGRDLLMEALAKYTVVGDGDVQISHVHQSGEDLLYFHLMSPDGEARISTSDVPARTWVTQSFLLVGKGRERVDVDGCIQRMFEGAS